MPFFSLRAQVAAAQRSDQTAGLTSGTSVASVAIMATAEASSHGDQPPPDDSGGGGGDYSEPMVWPVYLKPSKVFKQTSHSSARIKIACRH